MQGIIKEIADLARISARPAKMTQAMEAQWSNTGFLNDGYSFEDYCALAAKKYFYAALEDGKPVSFLTADASGDAIDAKDLSSHYIREKYGADVVIIRQIATHPGHRGKGHARRLYEFFAAEVSQDIYLSIVQNPLNTASEIFHARLGYEKCSDFTRPDGGSRGIWRKKTAKISTS